MREHWKKGDRECPPCPNCGEILYEQFWGNGGWAKASKSTDEMHSDRDCIARLTKQRDAAREALRQIAELSNEGRPAAMARSALSATGGK